MGSFTRSQSGFFIFFSSLLFGTTGSSIMIWQKYAGCFKVGKTRLQDWEKCPANGREEIGKFVFIHHLPAFATVCYPKLHHIKGEKPIASPQACTTFKETCKMNEKELKIRTRKFAVDVFNFVDKLPNRKSAHIIGNQLGRSASSIAANYRAACRGRSNAEFIAKPGIVEEESDETTFWLDILTDTNNATVDQVRLLLKEARELTAIFTASNKTAKQNRQAGST
jgi:four helix bundle protein